MNRTLPLVLLLLLTSASSSSAVEIRVRASTRLQAELERTQTGLHVTGTLQTDWGAPLSGAALTLETPDGPRELTTDEEGRFTHPLRRQLSAFTLVVAHAGDSRHGPSETSLSVHPGRAVSRLSLLVDPNRWAPGDRPPIVLIELQADGNPLGGEDLEAIIGTAPPVVLTTDSAGRARWAIPIDTLPSPGNHRIQALFEGTEEAASAHAESPIAWVSTPAVSIDDVRAPDGSDEIVLVGHASLPGVPWLATPVALLVDGVPVHTGVADPDGRVQMRLPRTSLTDDVFEQTRAFQLKVPPFRNWVEEVTTTPFHVSVPGATRAPLSWYAGLIASIAALLLLWRGLVVAHERAQSIRGNQEAPGAPGTLRGSAFDPNTGKGLPDTLITLQVADSPPMSTTSGPDGEFTFQVGDAEEGTFEITREGHLPTRQRVHWNPMAPAGALRFPVPRIRDEVLRLHAELVADHGEGHHATTLSPRRLLGRVMRRTQRRHDLHREFVDLIEAAAFRRDGASLQSLERVRELVVLLRPTAPGGTS